MPVFKPPDDLAVNAAISNRVYRATQIKKRWDDEWEYFSYLTPLQCVHCAAPEIPTAEFQYYFGNIMREGATSFAVERPKSLDDWYVRIITAIPGEQPFPYWTGVIANDRTLLERESNISGAQNINALGLEHLLDRIIIKGSYLDSGVFTPRTLTFNEHDDRGENMGIKGNRSRAPYLYAGDFWDYDEETEDPNGDEIYDFYDWTLYANADAADDTTPKVWTNKHILKAILFTWKPEDFDIELTGQTEMLLHLKGIYNFDGVSLWAAIQQLIPEEAGIGFHVAYKEPDEDDSSDAKDKLLINVFSLSPFDIKYQDVTLPGNPNRVVFKLADSGPLQHMIKDLEFRTNAIEQVDEIQGWGGPVRVTGTLAYFDDTLFISWLSSLEDPYERGVITGAGTETNVEVADNNRENEKYKDVFCTFTTPYNWDFVIGDGEGTPSDHANPSVDDNCEIQFETMTGTYEKPDGQTVAYLTFDEKLPFDVGKQYNNSPPTDNTPIGAIPERESALLWIIDDENADHHDYRLHSPTNRWLPIDHMPEGDGFRNSHLTVLNNRMGFQLRVSPNHYFAGGHFEPAVNNFAVAPEFDYRLLAGTFMWASHARIKYIIRRQNVAESDVRKRIHIEIPDTEYWYVCNGTVVGLDNDGKPVRIHPDNQVLRDDRDKVKAVVSMAQAWYGIPRQALQLPLKSIGYWLPIGAMLVSVGNISTRVPVNTPVTARHTDFTSGEVTLETFYASLDFVPLVSALKGKKTKEKGRRKIRG